MHPVIEEHYREDYYPALERLMNAMDSAEQTQSGPVSHDIENELNTSIIAWRESLNQLYFIEKLINDYDQTPTNI